MYSIFQTHSQPVYVTIYRLTAVFLFYVFRIFAIALRFCLRMHSIQLMWAKWRMFSCSKKEKKKRTSPFAIWRGLCGRRDYLARDAWSSPSFGLCFVLFFYSVDDSFCRVYTVQCVVNVVVLWYCSAMHTIVVCLIVSFRFTKLRSVPSGCSPVSLMFIWLEVTIVPAPFKAQVICVKRQESPVVIVWSMKRGVTRCHSWHWFIQWISWYEWI